MTNVNAKAIIVQGNEDNDVTIDIARELKLIVLEISPDPVISGVFTMVSHIRLYFRV
jgi:hypothetical protein